MLRRAGVSGSGRGRKGGRVEGGFIGVAGAGDEKGRDYLGVSS